MSLLTKENRSTILNAIFVTFWFGFLLFHLSLFFHTHSVIYLLTTVIQAEFLFFFVVRNKSSAVTNNLTDYVVAMIGTFAMFLFRPGDFSLVSISVVYVAIAIIMLLEFISFLSLNKSIGIVPANRGIQTSGLYSFVRHPIYLSYFLYYAILFISNVSVYNFFVIMFCKSIQIMRIYREEKLLNLDPAYRDYVKRVKWRILPGVF